MTKKNLREPVLPLTGSNLLEQLGKIAATKIDENFSYPNLCGYPTSSYSLLIENIRLALQNLYKKQFDQERSKTSEDRRRFRVGSIGIEIPEEITSKVDAYPGDHFSIGFQKDNDSEKESIILELHEYKIYPATVLSECERIILTTPYCEDLDRLQRLTIIKCTINYLESHQASLSDEIEGDSEWYREIIRMAYTNLGREKQDCKDYEEALNLYKRSLLYGDEIGIAHECIAECNFQLKDFIAAQQGFKLVIEDYKEHEIRNVQYESRYAWSLHYANETKKALQFLLTLFEAPEENIYGSWSNEDLMYDFLVISLDCQEFRDIALRVAEYLASKGYKKNQLFYIQSILLARADQLDEAKLSIHEYIKRSDRASQDAYDHLEMLSKKSSNYSTLISALNIRIERCNDKSEKITYLREIAKVKQLNDDKSWPNDIAIANKLESSTTSNAITLGQSH